MQDLQERRKVLHILCICYCVAIKRPLHLELPLASDVREVHNLHVIPLGLFPREHLWLAYCFDIGLQG